MLLAVGRRPNTDDLGLDRAGVAVDERGYIKVDDSLATNVPGIWALGDCNGRGAFTHTAYNDFEIVAANLLDGEHRKVSARIPVYALYTDPPLGRVGMTDTQARESGRPLLTSKRPMTRVGRAVEKGETQGFMKVVADAETRKILGAAILGTGGDEAIHGVIDIMNADAHAGRPALGCAYPSDSFRALSHAAPRLEACVIASNKLTAVLAQESTMQRRAFLKQSTLAVAGAAAGALGVPATASPDTRGQSRKLHPGGPEAAVRAVAVSLHAVHGTAGRDRWFRRSGLGPSARSVARGCRGGHTRSSGRR